MEYLLQLEIFWPNKQLKLQLNKHHISENNKFLLSILKKSVNIYKTTSALTTKGNVEHYFMRRDWIYSPTPMINLNLP